jgi:thiosulfate/3-mercaptopyruvate sulfurtransferase
MRPERPMKRTSSHPENVLVSPEWVHDRLGEFERDTPAYRLVEVDVNPSFYAERHAPSAVGLDWQTDLQSERWRDIPTPAEFADTMGKHGIGNDTTVVVYGDNANWFATHLYWQFSIYGHDDVRVMDGGRDYWLEHDFPTTDEVPSFSAVEYEVATENESIRAFRNDVYDALEDDTKLVDVRMPEEYRGDLIAPPGMDETARRGGHIPGAINVLWADNVGPDRRFKSPDDLVRLYDTHGIGPDDPVITYCRVGERSSITWFVLHELLGYERVQNYDGSWTEWGNLIRAPIETGE